MEPNRRPQVAPRSPRPVGTHRPLAAVPAADRGARGAAIALDGQMDLDEQRRVEQPRQLEHGAGPRTGRRRGHQRLGSQPDRDDRLGRVRGYSLTASDPLIISGATLDLAADSTISGAHDDRAATGMLEEVDRRSHATQRRHCQQHGHWCVLQRRPRRHARPDRRPHRDLCGELLGDGIGDDRVPRAAR